jgi:hypothetical protein
MSKLAQNLRKYNEIIRCLCVPSHSLSYGKNLANQIAQRKVERGRGDGKKVAKISCATLSAGTSITTTEMTLGPSGPVIIPLAVSAMASIASARADGGRNVIKTLEEKQLW